VEALPDRQGERRPAVEFSRAAWLSIFFVVAGCLTAFTGISDWLSAALAAAAATAVERTGQWWYGRELVRADT
jgi:hypothetical protein